MNREEICLGVLLICSCGFRGYDTFDDLPFGGLILRRAGGTRCICTLLHTLSGRDVTSLVCLTQTCCLLCFFVNGGGGMCASANRNAAWPKSFKQKNVSLACHIPFLSRFASVPLRPCSTSARTAGDVLLHDVAVCLDDLGWFRDGLSADRNPRTRRVDTTIASLRC
jgi:hypothetical protein